MLGHPADVIAEPLGMQKSFARLRIQQRCRRVAGDRGEDG
jgi:hypothetical protein